VSQSSFQPIFAMRSTDAPPEVLFPHNDGVSSGSGSAQGAFWDVVPMDQGIWPAEFATNPM
jgi:hypothetical protein